MHSTNKVTGTCLWYVTNLPLWLQKLVPVLRVPTHTSDRMSQRFPMNNIRIVLANWIITNALATCAHQPPVCQACIKWKLLLLEISTSICSPRCTLTTVHQSFLCSWDNIAGPHEEFLKQKYSSLSLFAYKVRGYLLWENPAAFQSLQICSSPRCGQKCFVWHFISYSGSV